MSYAVADQQQYTLRICEARCTTCIFHAGNRAHLAPGRLASLIKEALEAEGHIVCHATLDTDEPAICRGYANLPQAAERSLALRLLHVGFLTELPHTPPTKESS